MALKTDYQDDILNIEVNVNRRFRATLVSGETDVYEITDVTDYTQDGDQFGSNDINATNTEVNALRDETDLISDSLDTLTVNVKKMVIVNSLPAQGESGTLYFSTT